MSSKKYSVLSRVNHDNIDYEIGSSIELEADLAEPLLKVNAIGNSEVEVKAPAPEGEARVEAIKAAIAGLDTADTALWLKDGKPQSGAISNVTGFVVSAAERDSVWETVKPAAVVAEVNGMSASATTETTA